MRVGWIRTIHPVSSVMSFVWPAGWSRSVLCEWGGVGGGSEISVPPLNIVHSAPVASTPLPAPTGFTIRHSQTAKFGGCPHWRGKS